MHRTIRAAVACAAATVVALSAGCTTGATPGPDEPSVGPTATSTAAPDAARRLAERYHRWGGSPDVYGIRHVSGPGGAPLFVVWTHDENDRPDAFEELRGSVTAFLREAEGVSLRAGYLLDVYASNGSLQHRLDARP